MGVKNGVRIIKMILEKPMPSYIVIGGYKTSCTYEGQQPTCPTNTRASAKKRQTKNQLKQLHTTVTTSHSEDQQFIIIIIIITIITPTHKAAALN